jgi:hypothetical protein
MSFTFAQSTGTGSLIDDQIGNNLPDISNTSSTFSTADLKFKEGQSCETLENVLQEAMKKYGSQGYYGPIMYREEGIG